jgi:FkbM family methyltransferase
MNKFYDWITKTMKKDHNILLINSKINSILRKSLTKINYRSKYQQISYAQSGEDLIVNFIFSCLHIDKPSFIDIGAHHPFYLSNTAFFYNKGCRGINIEPNPYLIRAFNKFRRKDINLNIGISDNNEELIYYIMSPPTMSTFSLNEAERLEKETSIRKVEQKNILVKHINTVLDEYNSGIFPDFLSLDVEGYEDRILNTIDFENKYPKVICLETITYSENNKEKKEVELINFLINKGYFVYGDTYINTIFVRDSVWRNR